MESRSIIAPAAQSPYRSKAVRVRVRGDERIWFWTVLACFACVCLPLAFYLNIWQDEAYSLHSSSAGIVDAFRRGVGFEAQAPLYFVALAAWRVIDASAFFARLLSVVFSLSTLALTWLFARRYLKKVEPHIVVAAVAFNPFTVWAAVEIRPYAASIAFSAALLWLLFRGYVERGRPIWRVLYVCVAIAGTYTQYYVAFLLPAHAVALAILGRWRSLRSFCAGAIVFAIALLPLALVVPQQFQSYHAFAVAFSIPSYAMATVLLGYPFPHAWIGTWAHQPLLNGIYLGASLVPVLLAVRFIGPLSAVTKALLATVATLLVTYTAVIVVAHVHVLIPRHTLVMLVPLLACCFAILGDVVPDRKRLVLGVFLAVYAAFAVMSLWTEFHALSKVGDWRRVASYIDANSRTADGVALFNAEAAVPFGYYFKKSVSVAPIPKPMSFDRFDENSFVLHDAGEVAKSFGRFSELHRRTWLVETDACAPANAFFGCRYLNDYVRVHLRTLRTVRFDGTTVFELERR